MYIAYKMWRRPGSDDWAVTAIQTQRDMHCKGNARFSEVHRFRVREVVADRPAEEVVEADRDAPSSGYLEDGRRYVTYRMLLYCDGFTARLGKKGSCTGIYMLPLGIPPEMRGGSGAVRTIALAPPGVSQNDILRHIIDDVVEGARSGFPMIDSDGEESVMFLDCVGYVADSPAVTSSLDTLGHQSNFPCHLCTFGRYDESGSGGSRYSYSTDVHSNMLCFTRMANRTTALRRAGVNNKQMRLLGLTATEQVGQFGSVLQEFGARLSTAVGEVPKTDTGKPVVPCVFDCYRSTAVAPDHLVLGLANNLCDTILKLIPRNVREVSELIMLDMLRRGDLPIQSHLINHEKRVLHSMSISAMFAFVLVAPSSFRAGIHICEETGKSAHALSVVSLFEEFRCLVADVYFFPEAAVDGVNAVMRHNDKDGMNRVWALRERAIQYLNKLDGIYRTISGQGEGVDVAAILDKPNLHRFLELFTHTIPLFGHVRHIQELLFEGAHQPLKRGITASNGHNPELQAMEHRLSNDWKNRLAIECGEVIDAAGTWSDNSVRSVLRLLGWSPAEDEAFPAIKERVVDAFPTPVLDTLQETRDQLTGRMSRALQWNGDGSKYAGPREGVESVEGLTAFGEKSLRRDLSTVIGLEYTGDIGTRVHGGIKWSVVHEQGGNVARILASVRYGEVIQLLCSNVPETRDREDFVWLEGGDLDMDPTFWMFVAGVELTPHLTGEQVRCVPFSYRKRVCAVVKPMQKDGDAYRLKEGNNLRFLATLGKEARKVLAVHACSREDSVEGRKCEVRLNGSHVYHSKGVEESGLYYIYGRKDGYPPRCG